MKKSKKQKRREARAKQIAKQLEEKSKNIVLPVPIKTEIVKDKTEKATNPNAQENKEQCAKQPRPHRKANRMILVLAALCTFLFAVALGFALKGGSLTSVFWSWVAVVVFAELGVAFYVQAYVIEPREATRAAKEASQNPASNPANTVAAPPSPAPTDRAWLSIDVAIAGPLVFREGGVDLPIAFNIKNSGHSPANAVIVKAEIIFPQTADLLDKLVNRQKEICEKRRFDAGITIFHNTPKTLSMRFVLSRQEMEAQYKDQAVMKNTVVPVLIGCVDYTINDSSHHQTGFIYDIQTYDPAIDHYGPVAIPIGNNIPANQLVLRKWPFGGDFAN